MVYQNGIQVECLEDVSDKPWNYQFYLTVQKHFLSVNSLWSGQTDCTRVRWKNILQNLLNMWVLPHLRRALCQSTEPSFPWWHVNWYSDEIVMALTNLKSPKIHVTHHHSRILPALHSLWEQKSVRLLSAERSQPVCSRVCSFSIHVSTRHTVINCTQP